jgi:hypothetical protein
MLGWKGVIVIIVRCYPKLRIKSLFKKCLMIGEIKASGFQNVHRYDTTFVWKTTGEWSI